MSSFLSVPMLITLFRIIASVFILFPISIFYGINYLTGILYIIISVTDYLDGYYARKLNKVSYLGSVLDPLSDKILFISTTLPFLFHSILPVTVVFGMILRDFIVMTLREYSQKYNIQLLPSKSAKLKTANLSYITALTYFFYKSYFIQILWIIILISSWITLFQYLKFIYGKVKLNA